MEWAFSLTVSICQQLDVLDNCEKPTSGQDFMLFICHPHTHHSPIIFYLCDLLLTDTDDLCDTSVPTTLSSSMHNYYGSSPSLSPGSDLSSSAQPLSISTSCSSKSESDIVTFGGSVSPETPSKNVPLGIFELSPNIKTTMPRKLDVKVPKLDLNRVSKSKSHDHKQKLEMAMEKIIDVSNVQDTTGTLIEMDKDDEAVSLDIQRNVCHSPETTMKPKSTNDLSVSFVSSKTSINDQYYPNSYEYALAVQNKVSSFGIEQKQSSPYVKNLGQTIENCKAMLGIKVCDDVALVESESDCDEDGDRPMNVSDVTVDRNLPGSEALAHSTLQVDSHATNSSLGKKSNSDQGVFLTQVDSPHPKRMKLSKLCTADSKYFQLFQLP